LWRTIICTTNAHGGFRKGVRYSWVLNGADGMDLGTVGRFIASMQFEIIDADPAKNEFGHRFA
jgi:hypothetical protein